MHYYRYTYILSFSFIHFKLYFLWVFYYYVFLDIVTVAKLEFYLTDSERYLFKKLIFIFFNRFCPKRITFFTKLKYLLITFLFYHHSIVKYEFIIVLGRYNKKI